MGVEGRITKAVFCAIDEVNLLRASDEQLNKSTDQVLVSEAGSVDSLGLINLILATEEKISEHLGETVSLSDEMALSAADTPFKTIGTLITYIDQALSKQE